MKKPSLPNTVRIAATIAGPIVLTIAYFTLPLGFFGRDHEALSWIILGGLLVLMATGMTLLTLRALGDAPGHPGAGILNLSWASLLLFSASYWALSTAPGQFGGLSTRLDALYFTVITLATVGYGDIYPAGQTSRVVVMIQIFYSFAFLAAGLTSTSSRIRRKVTHKLGL